MASLLYELENNEAMLLLYVCGELPEDDRAEVEQMLASDGNLRLELEVIRSSLAESMQAVSAVDLLEPISSSAESVSIRNAGRLIKQWKVDKLRAQTVEPVRKALRYPMWVYPTSAVASILVGVLVWWGMSAPSDSTLTALAGASWLNQPTNKSIVTTEGTPQGSPTPSDTTNTSSPAITGVASDTNSSTNSNGDEKAAILESSFASEPAGLADAEAQANSLLSDNDVATTSVFPNEPAQ
jgi:hypothetical protein